MKIQKALFSCFEVMFIILLGLVLGISITGNQRNIEWYNVSFVTGVLFVAMLILYGILKKTEAFLTKHARTVLIVFVLIWGIALYLFSFIFRNNPAHDYQGVYNSALALAGGSGDVDWAYFAIFRNNFVVMMLVAVLMKIAFLLGISDPIFIMLLYSVGMVLAAGVCIFKLLKKAGYSYATCFMGLLLFAAFVPLWGGTFNLYSDCASLSYGILATYVLSNGIGKKRQWLYFVGAGILWGIGYVFKPTVIVSMVAIGIVVFLTRHWKKSLVVYLFVLIGFVFSNLVAEAVWRQTPCYELEEEYSVPFEYWFAIGLGGNGSDSENSEFAVNCVDAPGTEAKKEIAMQYIEENLSQLWNVDHLISKARNNFASGHMGLPDYNRYPVNIMYEFFNDYGTYGGYAVMYTSGYFYAILLYGVLSGVLHLKDRIQGRNVPGIAVVSRMTIYGLVIFMMLFEANNRQLYNHMPWLAMMAAVGCERVWKMRAKE